MSDAATGGGSEAFESTLEAARAGATWAWRSIVEDIDPPLRGYVARLGAPDPDDVVGETWLHVARGIHRFEGDQASFRSWVFTIGHHRIIDDRRRRRRRPVQHAASVDLDALSPSSPSAEAEAMESLEEADVHRILGLLPPAQREVVLLHYLGGFGATEIASIIGKRPGAVQALLRRGLSGLRRILESRTEERGPRTADRGPSSGPRTADGIAPTE